MIKKIAVGMPQRMKVNILIWKWSKPIVLEPRPLCNQKNIGGKANATNVGLLNIPITVMVAILKQWFKECEGNTLKSL